MCLLSSEGRSDGSLKGVCAVMAARVSGVSVRHGPHGIAGEHRGGERGSERAVRRGGGLRRTASVDQ